jgi:hypothetical protein
LHLHDPCLSNGQESHAGDSLANYCNKSGSLGRGAARNFVDQASLSQNGLSAAVKSVKWRTASVSHASHASRILVLLSVISVTRFQPVGEIPANPLQRCVLWLIHYASIRLEDP